MPAAGAEAHDRHLAVGNRLGAQERHAAGDIADDLLVGYTAGGAHARADIVGISRPLAEIEMRGDAEKAVMGELAGDFLDPFIPARHVMDDHHAGEWSGPERPGIIGFTQIAVVAVEGHGFRKHCLIRKSHSGLVFKDGAQLRRPERGTYHARA